MASFIPPLSISVSGNKCHCCRSVSVRNEPPPNYAVVCSISGTLIAVPQKSINAALEGERAREVFRRLQGHLKEVYDVELSDLSVPPLNIHRVPSVAQIRMVEITARAYSDGFKRGKSSSEGTHSPALKKSEDSDNSVGSAT